MENLQEVLSSITGTLNLKTLSWDAALRVVVLVLVGMVVIRVLMKLVDRLLERSKSLASLHVYKSTWPGWLSPWRCKTRCPTWRAGSCCW